MLILGEIIWKLIVGNWYVRLFTPCFLNRMLHGEDTAFHLVHYVYIWMGCGVLGFN